MEGYHDPFCRFPFPWHEVEGERPNTARTELLDFYRALGELRKSPAFHGGDFRILCHGDSHLIYERVSADGTDRYIIAANRGDSSVSIPVTAQGKIIIHSGKATFASSVLTLGQDSVCVIK